MNRSNEPLTARWMITGPMLGVVLADVGQIEPLGIAVVELNGAELPGAADRIEDVEVDLGAIKRPVARLELVRQPRRVERGAQRRLGAIPHLVGADSHFRARGELERRRQPERLVVVENEVDEERDFALAI